MLVIRPPVRRSPRGARSRARRTRRVGLLVVVDCKSSACRANWSARSAKGKSLRVWLRQAQHGVERRTDGFPAGLVSSPACTANRSREIACDPASAAWLRRGTTCRMTSAKNIARANRNSTSSRLAWRDRSCGLIDVACILLSLHEAE